MFFVFDLGEKTKKKKKRKKSKGARTEDFFAFQKWNADLFFFFVFFLFSGKAKL